MEEFIEEQLKIVCELQERVKLSKQVLKRNRELEVENKDLKHKLRFY